MSFVSFSQSVRPLFTCLGFILLGRDNVGTLLQAAPKHSAETEPSKAWYSNEQAAGASGRDLLCECDQSRKEWGPASPKVAG